MIPTKTAYFYFEASPKIGAGHAIRSCVLADALVQQGWYCSLITSEATYELIDLKRFPRIEPSAYFANPSPCNLLVIDHYGTAFEQEHALRPFTERLIVIDDLANRPHDCDLLIDQTYGCIPNKYTQLVPKQCMLLTGSDYVLLRKEFLDLRRSSKPRKSSKPVEKIMISMGGGSATTYILQALKQLKELQFHGHIDVVLGFFAGNTGAIEEQLGLMGNPFELHVNPNIAKLTLKNDLVFGAAGSGTWERCALGTKQHLVQIAANQQEIMNLFQQNNLREALSNNLLSEQEKKLHFLIDGLGSARISNHIQEHSDKLGSYISHKKVQYEDLDQIFSWQQEPSVRQFSIHNQRPTFEEHKQWFLHKLSEHNCIFETILCDGIPCGTLRLDYDSKHAHYTLTWYLVVAYQNRGIGTLVLQFAKILAQGLPIMAYVLKQNISSHRAMIKAGFTAAKTCEDGVLYEY